jgi:hypothetical protein
VDVVVPWVRRLANLLVLIGALGAGIGVVQCLNAMTQAPASVKAPVSVAPSGCCGDVRVELPGVTVPDGWLLPASPPEGISENSAGRLRIEAWGSTRLEQALASGDIVVGGIGFLIGALLIRPVLISVAEGQPFRRGNARRITLVAATVAVTGMLFGVPPEIAGLQILHRTGLDTTGDFTGGVTIPLSPLLTAALVLAVAAAFRAGEQLTREAEEMADQLEGLV